jgi:O-methyltransferase involved in polyketide biosynthesis
LHDRAVQSQWKHPILPDKWAKDAIDRIDYDFKRYKVDESHIRRIALRGQIFDLRTKQYLKDHSDATVLHLGCGLDSRIFRIDPPSHICWLDVDQPPVINLRRQLYPERAGYHLIAAPLEDLRWLDDVPGDYPGLVIAEGVMYYLAERTLKALLNKIISHFPKGEMIFDVHTRWAVWLMKYYGIYRTGATFRWGINNPQNIKRLEPRLNLITVERISDPDDYSRQPWIWRILYRLIFLRTIDGCILHYRF